MRMMPGPMAAMAAVGLALLVAAAEPAVAQTGKGLVDPNEAGESELAQLPHMTAAIAKGMVEKRPFKTVVELNKFLLDQKLTAAQAKEFYAKAFVKINLNTGAKEEFLLIPGVGARIGQQETDRLKQYVFIPPS